MDFMALYDLLGRVDGCTFATIDSVTTPSKGVSRVTKGEHVILFTNSRSSGYENMVKRRLEAIGKDPASFTVGELPFGERVPDTPLIRHNGNYYLQTILLRPGDSECFVGSRRVPCSAFVKERKAANQGLPSDKIVIVNTYNLDSIKAIRLMGEELTAALPAPT